MCLPGCKMSLFFECSQHVSCVLISVCPGPWPTVPLFIVSLFLWQISDFYFFIFLLAWLVGLFFDQISFVRLHLRGTCFCLRPSHLVPTPSQCVFGNIKRLEPSRAIQNSQSKIKFCEENRCNWPTLKHSRKKNSTDCINADGKDILLCIIIHTECTGNISKAHTAALLLEIYFCCCSAEVSG